MEIEDIFLEDFMKAWFNENYKNLSKERFEIAYIEYVDLSGLYSTKEFGLISYIHYLNNRINSIKISCKLQREFLNQFEIPCVQEFGFMNKFGHNLYWDGNKDNFIISLEKIELKERKYEAIYNSKLKELKELKEQQIKKQPQKKDSRHDFIKLLNSLGKILGYRIDREKTTVEEFALLLKQQKEEKNG